MHPVEILEKINEEIVSNSSSTILGALRKAFDSENDVELFKLRYLFIEQMEKSLESTTKSKITLDTFNDVYKGLTYYNLSERVEKIAPFITNAHIACVEAIFSLHDFKQDFDAVNEIHELNYELKKAIDTEEITPEQKKVLLEIYRDVNNAVCEHKITGNSAIKKLHESIFIKLTMYNDVIKSIKSIEVSNKFREVCSKVESVNRAMNTVVSLLNKVKDFIELLPNVGV